MLDKLHYMLVGPLRDEKILTYQLVGQVLHIMQAEGFSFLFEALESAHAHKC